MSKIIAQKAKQQIKQLARDTFETVKKTPGEMAESVLEQVGIPSGRSSLGQQKKPFSQAGQKTKLEQLEEIDKAKTTKQIIQLKTELEQEIDKWRRIREEQLRRRREQLEQAAQAPLPSETPLETSGSKPKRGSLFLRRQKGKTEMAAGKRSG